MHDDQHPGHADDRRLDEPPAGHAPDGTHHGSEERRPRPRPLLVGSAVAFVVALLATGALLVVGEGSSSPDRAPSVSFEMFDGTTRSLDDYRGQPLVVNFWASWCPPCISEMPEFEEVHQKVRGRVAFLGLNTQDTPDGAARIVEITGVTYDLARDPAAELFTAFEVFGMPSTFLISADGEILDRITGAITGDVLEDAIREHLL